MAWACLMAGLGVSEWTPREGAPPVSKHIGRSCCQRVDRRRSAPARVRQQSDVLQGSQVLHHHDDSIPLHPGFGTVQGLAGPLEIGRKQALSHIAGASRWLSQTLSLAADQLEDSVPASPPKQTIVAVAGKVKLTHWPPEYGYCEAINGWQKSSASTEWIYKPSHGIYFHTPSETLWKRARGDRMKFDRIDDSSTDFEAITIAAWGDSAAGQRTLLRACLLAWNQQLRKFEDMDRDLSNFTEGRIHAKPRTSASRTPNRGDALSNLLQPVATSLFKLIEPQVATPSTQSCRSEDLNWQQLNKKCSRSCSLSSSCSFSSEAGDPVSQDIQRLRSIARGSQKT